MAGSGLDVRRFNRSNRRTFRRSQGTSAILGVRRPACGLRPRQGNNTHDGLRDTHGASGDGPSCSNGLLYGRVFSPK